MTRLIGGVDIGIINMGFSTMEISCDEEKGNKNPWSLGKINFMKVINIKNIRHEKVPYKECKLYHSNHVVDEMNHFMQEYDDMIRTCSTLLIEQQPFVGITSVEALLFNKYRDMAEIVSPIAMHHFYGIQEHDYEGRKNMTTEIAMRVLKRTPKLLEQFQEWMKQGRRVHDISDVIVYLEMYRRKKESEWNKIEQRKETFVDVLGVTIDLELFRFVGSKNRNTI